MLYLFFFKPLRDHLRGFLIAAWAGDKIAEFSFPEISFHFPLRPWFFFVSPAYAGKSREYARGLTRARNHPRVCGEKLAEKAGISEGQGSPPHMRGKVTVFCCAVGAHGITPRTCGEKFPASWPRVCAPGSPPRMRGKANNPIKPGDYTRITPAYAGKRFTAFATTSQSRDHPRVCGEKARCDT